MTTNEWNELQKKNFGEFKKKYFEFQFNKKNILNCTNCPDNVGIQNRDTYPCGQYNCWVACACRIGIE